MSQLSTLKIICVERSPRDSDATYKQFRTDVYECLRRGASGMQLIEQLYSARMCSQVGHEYQVDEKSGGLFSRPKRLSCRLYQNPYAPDDICCFDRTSIEDGKVRVLTHRGGEYAVFDPNAGQFLMFYIASNAIKYLVSDHNSLFHEPIQEDVKASDAALSFSWAQRLAVGYTKRQLQTMIDAQHQRGGSRIRQFDAYKLG